MTVQTLHKRRGEVSSAARAFRAIEHRDAFGHRKLREQLARGNRYAEALLRKRGCEYDDEAGAIVRDWRLKIADQAALLLTEPGCIVLSVPYDGDLWRDGVRRFDSSQLYAYADYGDAATARWIAAREQTRRYAGALELPRKHYVCERFATLGVAVWCDVLARHLLVDVSGPHIPEIRLRFSYRAARGLPPHTSVAWALAVHAIPGTLQEGERPAGRETYCGRIVPSVAGAGWGGIAVDCQACLRKLGVVA
jgi:hypothetical protein